MRLILVRHGETESNVAKRIQGQLPGKLTMNGEEQAEKVGLRLKDEKIDFVYVSDLKRTKDTAERILKHHQLIPQFCQGLRERSFGDHEGRKRSHSLFLRFLAGDTFETFNPKGGEGTIKFIGRVRNFYGQIAARHSHDSVLFVTHGGWMSALLLSLAQEPLTILNWRKWHPGNTAVTILNVSPSGHKIDLLNCTKHLEHD
jgi:broad specificity phosphatase PhoE